MHYSLYEKQNSFNSKPVCLFSGTVCGLLKSHTYYLEVTKKKLKVNEAVNSLNISNYIRSEKVKRV